MASLESATLNICTLDIPPPYKIPFTNLLFASLQYGQLLIGKFFLPFPKPFCEF
jgi:hypothetical protein